MSNILDIHREKGVSFLEIIVVVAILGVTASFVMPSLSSWKINSLVERDFNAVISQVEYIKARVAVMNGTGLLQCYTNLSYSPPDVKVGYLIYSYRNTNPYLLDAIVPTTAVELQDTSRNNVVSGKAILNCNFYNAIFLSNGMSGIEGGSAATPISIEVNYMNDKTKYPAYKVVITGSTSFLQKYQWNSKLGIWTEIE
jgi:prepilin-type N-terminal cleavage/methylation domain-containing protein